MDNPYAAPESDITPPVYQTAAEQIRQAHLAREASIKSASQLYYLGAILCFAALIYSLAALRDFLQDLNWEGAGNRSQLAVKTGGTLLILGFMVLNWKLAEGLRKLLPWVRIPIMVLSVMGLLFFPLGPPVSGYLLFLMLAPKSKMVFSPGYQQVITATPHLRYRTSFLKRVIVVILVGACVTWALCYRTYTR